MDQHGIMPTRVRRKMVRKVNMLIPRLLDNQVLKGVFADITEHEIIDLCLLMPETLLSDPALIELQSDSPIMIVGDIYGQYGHLVRLFNHYGHPPQMRYIFLGNYVAPSPRSFETIALLFAYKICYPASIFLLRGKHECTGVSKFYGFHSQCLKRFSRRIWNSITMVYKYLPIAAMIDDKVFCVHSGLSPLFFELNLQTLDDLKSFILDAVSLPTEFGTNRLLTHLVWSDPEESIDYWEQNPVGMGYLYGRKVVEEFCQRYELQQIIRSSEMVTTGYTFFICPKLLTIFSAPDYLERFGNSGCLVYLWRATRDNELHSQMKMIQPIIRLRCKPTTRMNIVLSEVDMVFGVGDIKPEQKKSYA